MSSVPIPLPPLHECRTCKFTSAFTRTAQDRFPLQRSSVDERFIHCPKYGAVVNRGELPDELSKCRTTRGVFVAVPSKVVVGVKPFVLRQVRM